MKIFTVLTMIAVLSSVCFFLCKPAGHDISNWNLPNGDKVVFYHGPSGFFQSDHSKYLDLIKPDGTKTHYEFAQAHSGYNSVELRINQEKSIIWIVDIDRKLVGMSLNLVSNEFRNEGQNLPSGVGIKTGTSIPKQP